MASLLRQIVAGPRARHPEAGLDLCYVTDNIIATSGPSQTYPQLAYRNPLDQLVKFLDAKHGQDWAIWEFRAEGTGYPDEAVYNRVRHYPWPDHHPPPFRLVPMIMASMRNWLNGGDLEDRPAGGEGGRRMSLGQVAGHVLHKEGKKKKRVVVVHCKAGKGRSGTTACSYLIAEEGWKPEAALARFTERRMRPQFGAGVSIPSQLRWIRYVERWTQGGKKYLDRPIEIVEIHVWGLRNGVKVDVEGFADEGKKIRIFHTFKKEERIVVEGDAPDGGGLSDMVWAMAGYTATGSNEKAPEEAEFSDDTNVESEKRSKEGKRHSLKKKGTEALHKISPTASNPAVDKLKTMTGGSSSSASSSKTDINNNNNTNSADAQEAEPGGMAVVLRPKDPVLIPNSDVNISVERRNKTHKSMGLTMVTAVAHVWFNAFFEGRGPEQNGRPDDSGVFSIDWDAMDGIKGSSRKGARAMDRIAVVWRAAAPSATVKPEEVMEPEEGQPVPQVTPADWKGVRDSERDLGLRVQSPVSADVSKASSLRSEEGAGILRKDEGDIEGVKAVGPHGENLDERMLRTPEDDDDDDGDGKGGKGAADSESRSEGAHGGR